MRIQNPGAVYKSQNAVEHKAIAEANATAREAASQAMQTLAESLVPGSEAFGVRHDSGAVFMTGIQVTSKAIDVPPGLRWDTKAGRGRLVLVPAKRTEEGQAIQKQMDDLDHRAASLGAVSDIRTITDGRNQWFASAVIEVIGDDVYATYFHPLDDQAHGSRPSDREQVANDPGWREIALSEFYAARERAATPVNAVSA